MWLYVEYVVVLTFTVLLYIWGKPSLISHICSILTVLLLDDTSQCLVELRPHTQSITERLRPYRKYHEFLHSQSVTSMGAPIDHIKSLSDGQIKEMRLYFEFGRITFLHNNTGLTGTGRTNSPFPARSAMWRYKGTPFSAAPALHMASDIPRIALAPNLAGRNTEAVTQHTDAVSDHWCGNM